MTGRRFSLPSTLQPLCRMVEVVAETSELGRVREPRMARALPVRAPCSEAGGGLLIYSVGRRFETHPGHRCCAMSYVVLRSSLQVGMGQGSGPGSAWRGKDVAPLMLSGREFS